EPVAGRGAHVVDGGEVRREGGQRRLEGGAREGTPLQRRLDRAGAFRHSGHATEGDPRACDFRTIQRQVEAAADGGYVLIEPFRKFVAGEAGRGGGDRHRLDEFALRTVL